LLMKTQNNLRKLNSFYSWMFCYLLFLVSLVMFSQILFLCLVGIFRICVTINNLECF
jgi:hypothetical protein